MADEFAPKHYQRRCYNLLLRVGLVVSTIGTICLCYYRQQWCANTVLFLPHFSSCFFYTAHMCHLPSCVLLSYLLILCCRIIFLVCHVLLYISPHSTFIKLRWVSCWWWRDAVQVILIYHAIPDDLEWTRDQTSIPIPEIPSLIANAESADVVYSVSYNVFDYFKALFRLLTTCTITVQFSSVYSLNAELTKRNHTWNRPR